MTANDSLLSATGKKMILLLTLVAMFITGWSQPVTQHCNPCALKYVVKKLETDAPDYKFLYDRSIFQKAKPVFVTLSAEPLEVAVRKIFRGQPGLEVTFFDKTIVFSVKSNSSPPSFISAAARKFIGFVYDQQGHPLTGASVTVKGKHKVLVTDHRGSFPYDGSSTDSLLVSCVGYRDGCLVFGDSLSKSVYLLKTPEQLNSLTVEGYNNKDKSDNTSGTSTLYPGPLPAMNVAESLRGRVAGLSIFVTCGIGGYYRISLRGRSSIGTMPGVSQLPETGPLIVVDGIPLSQQNKALNQLPSIAGDPTAPGVSASGLGALFTLNQGDMESITVLKDADATAIYGTRGANGVILIQTKKGIIGKTVCNYYSSTGFGRALVRFKPMNNVQYRDMRRSAFENDGITPNELNAPDLFKLDTNRYTNIPDLLLGNTVHFQDVAFSFSRGDSINQLFISQSFHKENLALPADLYSIRNTVHVDFRHQSRDKKLGFGLTAYYSDTRNKWITGNYMEGLMLIPHVPALTKSDGSLNREENGVSFSNPLACLRNTYCLATGNFLMHAFMQYFLHRNLRVEVSVGHNSIETYEENEVPVTAQSPAIGVTGGLAIGRNRCSNLNIEPQLHYSKTFGKLQIQSLFGGAWLTQTNNRWLHSYTGFKNDSIQNIRDSTIILMQAAERVRYRILSGYSRIGLLYANRYMLHFTFRYDGSSRFGSANRWAGFYAIGAGYVLRDSAINRSSWLNYVKLRGSYGETGNDQIGDYSYLNTYVPSAVAQPYQGSSGLTAGGISNPNIAWERNRKIEAAVEVSLFKKRINLTAAWYRNRNGNQLISYRLPGQSGFSNMIRNFPAVVQNSGIEIELQAGKSWSRVGWSSTFTLARPRNKVVRFPDIENSSYARTLVVGRSLTVEKGWPRTSPDPKTGIFNANNTGEQLIAGDRDPKLITGLFTAVTFDRFQIDLLLEYVVRKAPHYMVYFYNRLPPGMINETLYSNQPVDLSDRWRKEGDRVPWQKFSSIPGSTINAAIPNWTSSIYQLVRNDWLRGKMLRLSYSLPEWCFSESGIRGVTVFALAENLFTVSGFKGADPETLDPFAYPLLRTVTVGFKLSI